MIYFAAPLAAKEDNKTLCNSGQPLACFNLGKMYYKGEGVKQDYIQAIRWYTKAAEQGAAKAEHALGFMYDKGKGVKQDKVQAVKWYTKAAEQGYSKTKYALAAMLHIQGGSVKQNKVLQVAIPISEREALIALYNATDGDNWKNKTG